MPWPTPLVVKNGLKICAWISGLIPEPVSVMASMTYAPAVIPRCWPARRASRSTLAVSIVKAAALRHRIAGIHHQVHDHLLDLREVRPGDTQLRLEPETNMDPRIQHPLQHSHRAGHHLVQIQRYGPEHLPSAEGQQLLGELGSALRGVLDLQDILMDRGPCGERVEDEFHVAHDRREQVVEVVGDAARELSDGLELL